MGVERHPVTALAQHLEIVDAQSVGEWRIGPFGEKRVHFAGARGVEAPGQLPEFDIGLEHVPREPRRERIEAGPLAAIEGGFRRQEIVVGRLGRGARTTRRKVRSCRRKEAAGRGVAWGPLSATRAPFGNRTPRDVIDEHETTDAARGSG